MKNLKKNRAIRIVCLLNWLFVLCLQSSLTMAQSDSVVYSFKKGEVLDLLFLTQKPETKELFNDYMKTAVPVGEALSYKPVALFRVNENLQGNYQPELLILAKWNDIAKRKAFLNDIEGEVPDFHQRRRNIWSSFGLTYYEMPADVNFVVHKEKFKVLTAYWSEKAKPFKQFKEQWLQQAESSGGTVSLLMEEGISPLGYFYQPDLFIITEWDSQESFERFHRLNLKMNHEGVKHVNQMAIN